MSLSISSGLSYFVQMSSASRFRFARPEDERLQLPLNSILITGFALPENLDPEAKFPHRNDLLQISGSIVRYFLHPEVCVRSGHGEQCTSFVSMPETAMDENAPTPCAVGDVWPPGQVPRAYPVSNPQAVQNPPHGHFWRGVLPAHEFHARRNLGMGSMACSDFCGGDHFGTGFYLPVILAARGAAGKRLARDLLFGF